MIRAPLSGALTTVTARRIFVLLAVISFFVLVRLGFGMTFFSDEWAFIESRSLGDPGTWLPPHNEHWTTLAILPYRLMVETIGLGSYVPYLAVLAGMHIVVSALVYRLLERSSGPLFALLGSMIVLVFGSGFEDLYWGFQTEFVQAVAFGLAALVVTDGPATMRRGFIVAALLMAALASSGIGIAMSIAVGVEWLLVPRWRRYVPILAIPAGLFLIWFVLFGRLGVETFRDPITVAAFLDVPRSVVRGLSNAFGSVAGLPGVGILPLIAFLIAGAVAAWRRKLPPRPVAIVLAITVQYALTGLVRAQLFEGIIDYSRYTYVSGILALVAAGALIGVVELPAAGRRRLVAIAVLGAWMAFALVANVGLLVLGRDLFLDRADMTRALVTVALAPNRPADVDMDRSLVLVPSPRSLEAIVAAYGDPRRDSLVTWAVRPIPAAILTEARRRLIEGAPIPGVSK